MSSTAFFRVLGTLGDASAERPRPLRGNRPFLHNLEMHPALRPIVRRGGARTSRRAVFHPAHGLSRSIGKSVRQIRDSPFQRCFLDYFADQPLVERLRPSQCRVEWREMDGSAKPRQAWQVPGATQVGGGPNIGVRDREKSGVSGNTEVKRGEIDICEAREGVLSLLIGGVCSLGFRSESSTAAWRERCAASETTGWRRRSDIFECPRSCCLTH